MSRSTGSRFSKDALNGALLLQAGPGLCQACSWQQPRRLQPRSWGVLPPASPACQALQCRCSPRWASHPPPSPSRCGRHEQRRAARWGQRRGGVRIAQGWARSLEGESRCHAAISPRAARALCPPPRCPAVRYAGQMHTFTAAGWRSSQSATAALWLVGRETGAGTASCRSQECIFAPGGATWQQSTPLLLRHRATSGRRGRNASAWTRQTTPRAAATDCGLRQPATRPATRAAERRERGPAN